MGKGIIVIDEIPKECGQCPLFGENDDYGCYCNKSKKFIIDKKSLPEWCEIKSLPEYRPEVITYGTFGMFPGDCGGSVKSKGRINKENIGFNECLDEILGAEK